MFALLLSGDGTVVAPSSTRAQLPLLLAQAQNLSTILLDQAVETDTAQTVTVFIGAALIPVEQAVETDTAQTVTVVVAPGNQFITVEQAVETDTAQTVTVFAPAGPLFITVDQAVETDTAFEIDYAFTYMRPVDYTTGLALVGAETTELELTPVVPL